MVIDGGQVPVLLQQIDGCLFSDATHTRDVIAGVADECLQVHQLLRGKPVLFSNLLRAEVDGVGQALACQADAHVVSHKLQQIPVAGQDHNLYAFFAGQAGDRAQHVIRLVAICLQDRDAEGGH